VLCVGPDGDAPTLRVKTTPWLSLTRFAPTPREEDEGGGGTGTCEGADRGRLAWCLVRDGDEDGEREVDGRVCAEYCSTAREWVRAMPAKSLICCCMYASTVWATAACSSPPHSPRPPLRTRLEDVALVVEDVALVVEDVALVVEDVALVVEASVMRFPRFLRAPRAGASEGTIDFTSLFHSGLDLHGGERRRKSRMRCNLVSTVICRASNFRVDVRNKRGEDKKVEEVEEEEAVEEEEEEEEKEEGEEG
jgi:hypothetical protein